MNKTEAGAVALVTGCSSGFGLLICVELACRGYTVIAGMRRPSAQSGLVEAAQEAGVHELISVVELDVTNEEQVGLVVSGIIECYGRIDVLVNNAGTAYGGFIEEVPLRVWKEQLETNFFGVVKVTQAVLPVMRKRGKGRIIQMSSISGQIGFPGFAPYVSSKFAVEGFSECLALEVKSQGIDVVVVEPGAYGTPIWEKGFTQMSAAESSPYQGMLERVKAFSRRSAEEGGDPGEVARLVADIAGMKHPGFRYALPRSTWLTLKAKSLLPDRLLQRMMSSVLSRKS